MKYKFIITDQQGNARISFNNTGSGGTAKVVQENSYYAFGLIMPGSAVGILSTDNKHLYNGGSEWQNDYSNLPDYYQTFNRNYDAALGRWIGVDPVAESAESMSSYQYAGNNPIVFNDPLGDNRRDPFRDPPPVNWNNYSQLLPVNGPLNAGWWDSANNGGAPPAYDNGVGLYNSDASAYWQLYNYTNGTFGGDHIYHAGNGTADDPHYGISPSSLGSNIAYYQQNGVTDVVAGRINLPGITVRGTTITYPAHWGDSNYFLQAFLTGVAAQMTYEFFTGTGQTVRIFYNDQVAGALQYSYGANLARAYFYNKYKNTKDLTNATVTNYDAPFGLPGVIQSGLNPIEQFAGTFAVNMWVDGDNLWFSVINVTSFQSLTYDQGPFWYRYANPQMGNTTQYYIWSEPIKRP